MANPTRFAVVHNIPSPYRAFLFERMRVILERRGISLEVHFMATGHADRRYWGNRELTFRHVFWPDRGVTLRAKEWHFNPGMLRHLWHRPPAYLMVGGPWDSVTGLLASFTPRVRVRIAWFEGNTRTPGRISGAARIIKKALLSSADVLAVPGSEGKRFAELFGDNAGRTVLLPNLVDEERFATVDRSKAEAFRRRVAMRAEERLAVWPARLIAAKGILPFLTNLPAGALNGWVLALIGDGPLRDAVAEIIAARGLERHVRIVEPCAYEDMPAVYQAADLFLLPSVHDPNPLSVVEAMHSGLPLLISDRLGNYPEAFDGTNGWVLDPSDASSVRAAASAAFGASREESRRRGDRSKSLAAAFWGTEVSLQRFIATVVERERGSRCALHG